MSQLTICRFVVIVALSTSAAFAQNQTAQFSVLPATIESGTSVLGTCTISGFEPDEVVSFSITYWMKNQKETDDRRIADWTNDLNGNSIFSPISYPLPDHYGLTVTAGNNGTFPVYAINLNLLKGDDAEGSYWCTLKVMANISDAQPIEVVSNSINTTAAAFTSTLLLNSNQFTIGTALTGSCRVRGEDLAASTINNVNFYFSPNITTRYLIAQFTGTTFTSLNSTEEVTALSGQILTSSNYSVSLQPNSVLAAGQYQCSVVMKQSANSNAREYFSNEFYMKSSANWAVPSILLLSFVLLIKL